MEFRQLFINDFIVFVSANNLFWGVLAFFTSMAISIRLVTEIYKKKLKNKWSMYVLYMERIFKYNFIKLNYILEKVLLTLVLLCFVFLLNWYTVFKNDSVKINHFLSFRTIDYKYSDILELRDIQKLKALNGDVVNGRHYIILFKDGYKWNSRESGFDDYYWKDRDIIDMLEDKTNLETVFSEFDKDD